MLFFEFFKKTDQYSQIDVFRSLETKFVKVKVINADLTIDGNGKTLVKFEFTITFKQFLGQREVTENIPYIKTHKQIKAISQELGLEIQKVKYLDKAQQMSIIEKQLQKVFTQTNLDRNTVIDFLIQDYNF